MSKNMAFGLFKYLRENVTEDEISQGMIKAHAPIIPIKETEEPEIKEPEAVVEETIEPTEEGKVPTNKDDSEATRKELLEQGDKEIVLGTFSDKQVAEDLARQKRGTVVEDAETKMFKVVVKETMQEKKAMPTCSKCNKKHWPFQKCGAGPAKGKAKGKDKEEPKAKGKKGKAGGAWWDNLKKKKKNEGMSDEAIDELEKLMLDEGIEINIKDAGGEATVKVKTDGEAATPEVIVNDEPVVELPNDNEPPVEAPEDVPEEEVVEEIPEEEAPLESKVEEPVEPVEEAKIEEGADDFTMGFVEALQKSLKEVVGAEVKVEKIVNKLKTTDRVGLEALKQAMEQRNADILREFLNMLLENKE